MISPEMIALQRRALTTVLLIVLPLAAAQVTVRSRVFQQRPDLEDLSVTLTPDLLLRCPAHSAIQCGLHCVADSACEAFVFESLETECVLFNQTRAYSDPGWVPNPGALFFVKLASCGPPPAYVNMTLTFNDDVTATYACLPDFTLTEGSMMSQCKPDLLWSAVSGVCQQTTWRNLESPVTVTVPYPSSLLSPGHGVLASCPQASAFSMVIKNETGADMALMILTNVTGMWNVIIGSGGQIHYEGTRGLQPVAANQPFNLTLLLKSGLVEMRLNDALIYECPEIYAFDTADQISLKLPIGSIDQLSIF